MAGKFDDKISCNSRNSYGEDGTIDVLLTTNTMSSQNYERHQDSLSLMKTDLKLTSHEQDGISKENGAESRTRRLAPSGVSSSSSDKSLCGSRDYDRLKSQCDIAMRDLHSLRLQHVETVRKCDAAIKESEFYRTRHKLVLSKLDQQQNETLSLRTQYNELLADKFRLEQEVGYLQKYCEEERKEVADLRRQQQEAIHESGNGDALNQMYVTAIRKYENLRDDFDSVQKRYAELAASHSAAVGNLDLAKEECARFKKQNEEVIQDLNAAIKERNGLKQQCTEAIRQWDSALRDRNEIKEALTKAQQQRDEAVKEINQAMAVRIKASKDMARLAEERNAAVQEYSLIMSERDTVHKEIEKLQEELSKSNKKLKSVEALNKTSAEEAETLRREIVSALHDRDRALKECSDLREKYGDYAPVGDDLQNEAGDHHKVFEVFRREREFLGTTHSESLLRQDSIHDNYANIHKERVDNLDQANQEIDRLRKKVEKCHAEIIETQQEAEVSKRRRDWAFTERDKIVLERESIRTLCDKLRKERDRAVSDLAEALRDSDDIKKQKNEATKELKEYREAQLEKESRMKQLNYVGHNLSRDSAIDTDLQEWETETLEFDIGGIGVEDFGFELAGGKDDPQHPDGAIFVTSVTKGSGADGKLKINDCLLRINNVDLVNVERRVAVDAVKNSGGVVNMVVRRRKSASNRLIQTVTLNLGSGKDHGLSLETGVYIMRIAPGSVAAKEGNLAIGDRVFNINGCYMDGLKSGGDAMRILESVGDVINVSVVKGMHLPSAPLSSSSSSHNITENMELEKNSCSTLPGLNSPHKNVMRTPVKEPLKKMTTSSAQTDEPSIMEKSTSIDSPTKRGAEKEDAVVPHPPPSLPPHTLLDHIFGGRWSSKERREKKLHQNSSSYRQREEEEAIAELDSAIETSASKGKLRKKRDKTVEKNGGTWPKYKGPPVGPWDTCQSTVTHTPKRKERVSIASLLNTPRVPIGSISGKKPDRSRARGLEEESDRDQLLMAHERSRENVGENRPGFVVYERSSQTSSPSAFQIHPLKPSHFLSSPKPGKATYQPSASPLHHSLTLNSKSRSDVASGQTSSIHYMTTSSLDYSVVSANRDKEVLEYYKNKSKSRPKSAIYLQNDSDCFSSAEMSSRSKPSGMDIQALCKPIQPLNSMPQMSLSPLDSIKMSPRLLDHGQSLPTTAFKSNQSYSGLPTSLPHSSANTAYYTVSSSQMPHTHTAHCHPHGSVMASTSSVTGSKRYSTPPSLPHYVSRSGESLLSVPIPESSPLPEARLEARLHHRVLDGGRYSVNPSPSPSQHSCSHSRSPSLELHHYHLTKRPNGPLAHPTYENDPCDGTSTLPKRTHCRIRIPSNQSVTSKSSAGKVSTSSIEKASSVSDRGSPMLPACRVETITAGGIIVRNSVSHYRHNKPVNGELRNIRIEKSTEEPLGIQICCNPRDGSGIFVSSVSDNSLAAQLGVYEGDQLLEVCGINMRSATYELAASVLRQCGDSITMLVQYSPEKYREAIESSSPDCSPVQTPTPSSSPSSSRNQSQLASLSDDIPASATSTLKRQTNTAGTSTSEDHGNSEAHEPRFVFLKKSTSNLGIKFLGGNAVGIFVHWVQPDSPAVGQNGLRCGDQILEYNGVDLRNATAEQAAYQLSQPADTITILAQYSIKRYNDIQLLPGDAFFIRAMFDRQAETPEELSFHKDDILYVDNTMFKGVPGLWRAWIVDEDGHKRQYGVIPSKFKVEEELLLRRSLGELDSDPKRGSTLVRRSFFRRKKHQRSNSRDSKELASFSDVSINSFMESGSIYEDPPILTYQIVERLDYLVLRPVLLLGPMIEVIVDMLIHDFPHKFARCEPESMHGSLPDIEKGLQDDVYIDFRRRGSHFECITLASIKEICDKTCHCIIDVGPSAVERLHRHQLYPIVLFIKFKSTKQIREVKDSRLPKEKVTMKAAKEMYEHSLRIENEYKHLISASIPGGNLAYMCTQIKARVDQEQSKTLWVPTGSM